MRWRTLGPKHPNRRLLEQVRAVGADLVLRWTGLPKEHSPCRHSGAPVLTGVGGRSTWSWGVFRVRAARMEAVGTCGDTASALRVRRGVSGAPGCSWGQIWVFRSGVVSVFVRDPQEIPAGSRLF